MTTAHDLAEALDGVIVPNHGDPRIVTAAGLVYTGCTGKVRLQRTGKPVTDLGRWTDDTAELVAAYEAVVGTGVTL